MKKLYMFSLGGNAGRSNIEVHDIQFAAVEKIEDAYPYLREVWFGDKDKLHLDGYMPVTWADGYDISLSTVASDHPLKLFFVNVGAYSPESLAELHAFDLFVAEDAQQAKEKALQQLLLGKNHQHRDNLKDVDNCLLLDNIGSLHIQLSPNPNGSKNVPEWQGYRPIGAIQNLG